MRRDDADIDGLRAQLDAQIERMQDSLSGAPEDSEIWLAERFASRVSDRFRWSASLDWMVNLGTHYCRDDSLERYSAAKALCSEMAAGADKALKRTLASAKTVNALLSLARAESGIATPIEAWDREPMVLNTPAGPVDLTTGAFLERGDRLFTQIAGAAPDFKMKTPNWLRFISEIFTNDPEMVEFIQRWGGYCLTGDRREQKILFAVGDGANGKSVYEEALRSVAGTYALNLPAEVLMRQQHTAHPTELAQLRGKRLAVSSELEDGSYWAESRIKSLTGDATLRARFMRMDFFEFPQTQKHIVLGNFRPRLRGDDPAIARRMLLVPFKEKFTGVRCDPLLPAKLRREYPGILAWFIQGAVKWARDGLRTPQSVLDASAAYLADHDDIGLWIADCCVAGNFRTPASSLYASFTAWKEAAGERPQSQTAWGARMAQRFPHYRTMSARGYEGIGLRDQTGRADYLERRA